MSKISIFTFMVLNSDISIIFLRNIFKLSVVVLNTLTERTVSQISFLGHQILCNLENTVFKNCKMFPVFGHKIKTKP